MGIKVKSNRCKQRLSLKVIYHNKIYICMYKIYYTYTNAPTKDVMTYRLVLKNSRTICLLYWKKNALKGLRILSACFSVNNKIES